MFECCFKFTKTGSAAFEHALNNRIRGSKIAVNSVFYCHLSPVGRQMAIENTVSSDCLSMFVDSTNVFDCRLPGVTTYTIAIKLSIFHLLTPLRF